jgi:hypothetical protein
LTGSSVYIGERDGNELTKQEVNMSFKSKVAILLVAVFITLFGFNLIASSSALDIMKIGKQAGYEIIANVLARAEAHRS